MSSDPEQNDDIPQQPVETTEETTQGERQEDQQEEQEEDQEEEQEEQERDKNDETVDASEQEQQKEQEQQEEQEQRQERQREVSYGEHTDEVTETYDEGTARPVVGIDVVVHSSVHSPNLQEDVSTTTRGGGRESFVDHKSQMSETLPPSKGYLSVVSKRAVDVTDVSEESEAAPVRKSRSSVRSEPLLRTNSNMKRRVIPSGTLTPLYNANNMTTREEFMAFRIRNGVSPNYRGPVHVVENIYVSCAECGAPVDPVTRVPAGKLFFHPQCIRCKLCGKSSLTEAYFQAMYNAAICWECASRGLAPCVPREAAAARGIITGAVYGPVANAIRRHDRERQIQPINQSTLEGVVAPTLSVPPLHNRRNSTRGTMALIRRQQYYTQNDNNILCLPPATPVVESQADSRPSTTPKKRRSRQSFPKLM
ncbi:hypothetical protein LSM04_008385 [Trypanosoma melophagium]|uniref:uncharacterized protein n=1 Tax=Trypanosoma melophagium TaxID=715481 RepID=UPI00351A5285|nr:hypothetical protein LSM04_008385 [Trypanosoma melophagium]